MIRANPLLRLISTSGCITLGTTMPPSEIPGTRSQGFHPCNLDIISWGACQIFWHFSLDTVSYFRYKKPIERTLASCQLETSWSSGLNLTAPAGRFSLPRMIGSSPRLPCKPFCAPCAMSSASSNTLPEHLPDVALITTAATQVHKFEQKCA